MIETQTETQIETKKDNEVAVIILLYKNPNFKGFTKPFDLEIYGKKMWKYVELATSDYPTKTTICTPETDILSLIKPMLTNSKYTLVLYSDTPLIQKNTVFEIIKTFSEKQMNVCRLQRGFVFDTEYIKNATSIQAPIIQSGFDPEDFTIAFDLKSLEFVSGIMKTRILDFHQNNGIFVQDFSSTFIDADAIVDVGVIIEPNNIIKGSAVIGKNTVLQSGNVISNSIIGSNCILQGAYIENSKIADGSKVQAFERIIGK